MIEESMLFLVANLLNPRPQFRIVGNTACIKKSVSSLMDERRRIVNSRFWNISF